VKLLWRLAKVSSQLHQLEHFAEFVKELCWSHRGAWRNASRILRKLDRPSDAVDVLLQVHKADPSNAEVCCALAKLEPRQAREWYEKAVSVDPLCMEAVLAVADEYRKVDGKFAEAARLYEAALRQRPGVKLLYRLGECLVQDGRGAEGRHYLMKVLSNEDRSFDMHAVVMIALSYTMSQQHDKALEFCQRAEEIHSNTLAAAGTGTRSLHLVLLKHAWICKGVTHLNAGFPERAIETLRLAAREAADRWADENIESFLGLAEILRGDMAAAERHLEQARRLGMGPPAGPDVLVNTAYLRQAQGDLEAAHALLSQCLDTFKSNAMALLRMGYVLLCQENFDQAVQFLQKCLQQPAGTLTYGTSQKGVAHLYLSIALHFRNIERSTASVSGSAAHEQAAEEQFRNGHELLPHFSRALLEHLLAVAASGTGSAAHASLPSRIGMVDFTFQQAMVLLLFAEHCGLVPVGSWNQMHSATSPAVNVLPNRSPPGRASLAFGVAEAPSPISIDATPSSKPAFTLTAAAASPKLFGIAASTPLVGTTSTAAPTSSGPSRDVSVRDLHGSTCDLSARLPAEKLLRFSELELADCISHGEFTVVHRGVFKAMSLDVVVKTLHQRECLQDEQAIAELRAEISVIAELSHPRIVTFVGACLEPSQLALVTELAPGGNLHQALHVKHRRLKRYERFQLASELLEGVRYLHQRSPPIAHLDLKSMNLVLDEEGQHLQICDFGLARVLGDAPRQSSEGEEPVERSPSRGGSPRYMSPECYDTNLGAITEKADVWSSGCILIEIFGETLPYAECSNVQQILKLMLVHKCGPSIPESIEASVRSVITSTLAFEAQERQSIAQVLLQLQTVANSNASEHKSRFMWIP
jgi:tetratricopeptide (TPR) repeat protein